MFLLSEARGHSQSGDNIFESRHDSLSYKINADLRTCYSVRVPSAPLKTFRGNQLEWASEQDMSALRSRSIVNRGLVKEKTNMQPAMIGNNQLFSSPPAPPVKDISRWNSNMYISWPVPYQNPAKENNPPQDSLLLYQPQLGHLHDKERMTCEENKPKNVSDTGFNKGTKNMFNTRRKLTVKDRINAYENMRTSNESFHDCNDSKYDYLSRLCYPNGRDNGDKKSNIPLPSKVHVSKLDRKTLAEKTAVESYYCHDTKTMDTVAIPMQGTGNSRISSQLGQHQQNSKMVDSSTSPLHSPIDENKVMPDAEYSMGFVQPSFLAPQNQTESQWKPIEMQASQRMRRNLSASSRLAYCGNYVSELSSLQPGTSAESGSSQSFKSSIHSSSVRSPSRLGLCMLYPERSPGAAKTNDPTYIDSSNLERDSFITTSGSRAPPKYTNSCLYENNRPYSASNVNQRTNSDMLSTSNTFQRASHALSVPMHVYNRQSLANSTQRDEIREESSEDIWQPAVDESRSILDHDYMNVHPRSSSDTTQSDKVTHSSEAVKPSDDVQKSVSKRQHSDRFNFPIISSNSTSNTMHCPSSAVKMCKPQAGLFQDRNRTSHDLKMMLRKAVLKFKEKKLKEKGESLTEDIKPKGKLDSPLLDQGSTTTKPITDASKYTNSRAQNSERLRRSRSVPSNHSRNSAEYVERKRSERMDAQTAWNRNSLHTFSSSSFHSDAGDNINTSMISRQSTLQPPLSTVEPGKSGNTVRDPISGSGDLSRPPARQRTRSGKQEQSQEVLKSGVSRTRDINSGTSSSRRNVCLPKNFKCDGEVQVLTTGELKGYFGENIGKRVYKAKKLISEDSEFVIKEVSVTDEVYQMSFEKEIKSGRVLHPFIIPVIARAEKPPTKSEIGVSYLMFPYMKNRDLRHNIDLENIGRDLCTSQEESNSIIWTRCIYQITQALHYLHTPIMSVRGPVFHRDLTSRNIFLDENFNVRIGDFGIAAEANFSATQVTVSKVLGMEGYHPPSMSQYKYDASYDIFGFGVVILEILTGERAVLKGDPYFLHKKYNCDHGIKYLVEYLDHRAKENKAASWTHIIHRNKLAEIALNMVRLNGTCKKTADVLQKLDRICLDSRELYREPTNTERCVSCCINPPAKLPLQGINCVANGIKRACRPFCLRCLMNDHINPLFCPKHGKTRPPFGDHVYGVFVAGNSVKGMQHLLNHGDRDHNFSDVAHTFIKGVEKVVKVLTTKHPFVLGASSEHLKIVKPKQPGTIDEMAPRIIIAFDDVNTLIKEALEKNNLDQEKDRLPNSLFIFYFSGHCSKDKGLYLGNADEILKASTKWIKEMLHMKLRVDQILVILDCCHAESQKFDDRQGLNPNIKYPDNILQLSSCDKYETSNSKFRGQGPESNFTHFLCQSLRGLERTGWGEDEIVCCQECDIRRQKRKEMDITLPCLKYFFESKKDQCVKVGSIRDFIQGHFDLMRGETSNSGNRRIPKKTDIVLAYYNPYQSFINIHLRGSETNYCLKSYPGSMDRLKKDIINYIVEKNVNCEIMQFHKSYGKGSSRLIAICRKHLQENEELTSLECIYKAWSLGHQLETHVRGNIKGLIHGPVELKSITRRMVTESRLYYNSDHLKLNEDSIQIPIKSFRKAEEELWGMEQFSTLIEKVSQILRSIRTSGQKSALEKKHDSVLRFYLYDKFSVLAIQ